MNKVQHIAGYTYHGRKGEIANAFRYRVDYVLLDMDADVDTPRLFARNARNLIYVFDSDKGGLHKEGRGADWVRDVLAEKRGQLGGKILLLK